MFSNRFYWILLDSLRHIISCLGGYWQVRIIERLRGYWQVRIIERLRGIDADSGMADVFHETGKEKGLMHISAPALIWQPHFQHCKHFISAFPLAINTALCSINVQLSKYVSFGFALAYSTSQILHSFRLYP